MIWDDPRDQSWRRPDPATLPPMETPPAPSAPPRSRNLLDRIFGRLFPMPEGLLSEEETRGAQQQGMLGLGLGLLEAAGPSPVPVSLGQAFARSLPGAREGVGAYASNIVAQRKQQEREALLSRYQPMLARVQDNPSAMAPILTQMMADMLRMGDTEGAGKLSEVIKSMGGASAANRPIAVPGGSRLIDPTTGRVITEIDPRAGTAGGGQGSLKIIRGADGQPEYAWFNPATRKFEGLGVRPGTNRLLTETQAKMAAWLEMIEEPMKILDAATAPDRWTQFARGRGLPEGISDAQQVIDVASRQVADAFLRMTTGAAYNSEELTNALIINTPRSGDRVPVLEYKKKVRASVYRALRILASGQFYNDAEAGNRLIRDATRGVETPVPEGEGDDSTDITPPWERP